jgi:glycosyltransferase involved in cell wall biosynthesis
MIAGSPRISVILCTFNRAQLLPRALHSLFEQSLEKSEYEIVVVDNASTDNTAEIIKEFEAKYSSPIIVPVYELRQGLAYARNTGCKHATGRYLAFIDDDCLAETDWLQVLWESYERIEPSPLGVGGIVAPLYDERRPKWFKESYELDTWGDQPRFLEEGESFTGCNMSFRRDVISTLGGFNVEFGMGGENLALAEETELFRRIWATEGKDSALYYTPRAVVQHDIDPHKMTVSYQLKRAFSAGQASWDMAQSKPVAHRLLLFAGSIALIPWHCIRSVLYLRAGYWQNWIVEAFYPVASNIGRVAASIGVRVTFRQRSAKEGPS